MEQLFFKDLEQKKKRTCRKYSPITKISAVDFAKINGKRAAGRHFQIAEATIRTWFKQEQHIREEYVASLTGQDVRTTGCSSDQVVSKEEVLVNLNVLVASLAPVVENVGTVNGNVRNPRLKGVDSKTVFLKTFEQAVMEGIDVLEKWKGLNNAKIPSFLSQVADPRSADAVLDQLLGDLQQSPINYNLSPDEQTRSVYPVTI